MQPIDPAAENGFEKRRRLQRRLVAACAMVVVAVAFRSDYLTDWDAWDYASQAVSRHASDLFLGRWWFVAAMRGAYLLGDFFFGLSRLDGYLAMQTASVLFMAAAVWVAMTWVYRLTRSSSAEVFFACLFVMGPLIGIYASAVMTESMTLLTLGLTMLLWDYATATADGNAGAGRRAFFAILAGLSFGIAVNTREPAVLLAAWPILTCFVDRPPKRWLLLGVAMLAAAVTLGFGVFMAIEWRAWAPVGADFATKATMYWKGISDWTREMAEERLKYPVGLGENILWLLKFIAASTPIAALLAVPAVLWTAIINVPALRKRTPQTGEPGDLWRRRRRMIWLVVAVLPYCLAAVSNHDLKVNPRFMIPPAMFLAAAVAAAVDAMIDSPFLAPFVLFGLFSHSGPHDHSGVRKPDVPAASPRGEHRRKVNFAVASLLLIALAVGTNFFYWDSVSIYYLKHADDAGRMYETIRKFPARAALIPGSGTPSAYYLNRIKTKEFDVIDSGWAWPGKHLTERIRKDLAERREVYVMMDYAIWHASTRKSQEWDELCEAMQSFRLEVNPEIWPFERIAGPAGPASKPADEPAASRSSVTPPPSEPPPGN